jgi:hypothetical protein
VVKIQPRDLQLLESLSRYGVLSTKQIQKLIFSNIQFTTMMRRMRLLESDHFIRRGVTLTDQSFTWRLAWRGEQRMSVEIPGSFSNRNIIDHDVLVNDIRMRLESFNLAKKWRPEFELKSEAFRNQRYRRAKERLISDGILYENKAGEPWMFAIEVELTRKSESRYKRIFQDYQEERQFHRIWYFVQSTQDAQAILKSASKALMFNTKRLWFSVIDSFLASDEPKVFSVNANSWIPLSDIGFDHFHGTKPAQLVAHGVSTQVIENSNAKTEANSLNSCVNSQNQSALHAEPSAPDPSPSTMERGQELQAKTNEEKCELAQDLKFKKCG